MPKLQIQLHARTTKTIVNRRNSTALNYKYDEFMTNLIAKLSLSHL